MENPNTVQITAYTPNGFRVYVNVDLVSASELDTLLEDKGYLSHLEGANVGEVIETMTHVSRRLHTSKKDGSVTPMIAFYHENTGMNWKYDHMYFNTQEQIAEFETVSGITLDSIPVFEGDNFIARDNANAAKYIIQLRTPVKVVGALKPYKKLDGTQGETMKIQRFLGADTSKAASPQEPPAPTGEMSQDEKATWNAAVMAGTVDSFANLGAQKAVLTAYRDNGTIGYHQTVAEAISVVKTATIPF